MGNLLEDQIFNLNMIQRTTEANIRTQSPDIDTALAAENLSGIELAEGGLSYVAIEQEQARAPVDEETLHCACPVHTNNVHPGNAESTITRSSHWLRRPIRPPYPPPAWVAEVTRPQNQGQRIYRPDELAFMDQYRPTFLSEADGTDTRTSRVENQLGGNCKVALVTPLNETEIDKVRTTAELGDHMSGTTNPSNLHMFAMGLTTINETPATTSADGEVRWKRAPETEILILNALQVAVREVMVAALQIATWIILFIALQATNMRTRFLEVSETNQVPSDQVRPQVQGTATNLVWPIDRPLEVVQLLQRITMILRHRRRKQTSNIKFRISLQQSRQSKQLNLKTWKLTLVKTSKKCQAVLSGSMKPGSAHVQRSISILGPAICLLTPL